MSEKATIVKEPLTKIMIEAGAALAAKLDEMGVPIGAILWWWDVKVGDWKLMLGSDELALGRGRATSKRIDEATDSLGEFADAFPIFGVSLMDPRQEPLVSLREYERTSGKELSNKRLKKSMIMGSYIDDALIYRV